MHVPLISVLLLLLLLLLVLVLLLLLLLLLLLPSGHVTGQATTCTRNYTHRTDRWIYPLGLTVLLVKAVMIYMHVTTNSRKKSK